MYDKLADFEQEMFNLQKNHRQNIRELLEESDRKMNTVKQQHSIEMESIVRFFLLFYVLVNVLKLFVFFIFNINFFSRTPKSNI
jgi:hypothetical protein